MRPASAPIAALERYSRAEQLIVVQRMDYRDAQAARDFPDCGADTGEVVRVYEIWPYLFEHTRELAPRSRKHIADVILGSTKVILTPILRMEDERLAPGGLGFYGKCA